MSEPTPPTVDRIVTGGAPTIFVSDLDRAVTFYTTTLGLDLEYRAGNDFAMIDAGQGFKIGLHPPSQQGPVPGTHGAISVGLTVSEPIEQVMETLRQRGVTFRGPIVDDGSVRLAFFGDPDGNDLYLCEVGSG